MAAFSSIADRLSCRQVLNIMVILGFMLNYMLRVNLTIAIVAMVVQDETALIVDVSSGTQCNPRPVTESTDIGVPIDRSIRAIDQPMKPIQSNQSIDRSVKPIQTLDQSVKPIQTLDQTVKPIQSLDQSVRPIDTSVSNRTTTQIQRLTDPPTTVNNIKTINGTAVLGASPDRLEKYNQTRYKWDEYQVNIILGSFFWGYVCTELPGGRLAEIIGARKVFGYSMLVSSVVTLFTPLAATFGYAMVAALRVVLGFMLGATWPAIQPMTSRWIPPMERSKFVSNMMASSLGAAITMPVCGFLIAAIGWESVFYVTGGIGLVWSLTWFVLVFDSPAEHPRITVEERRSIEDAIGTTWTSRPHCVPWKAIFTSLPVWAIIITHGCSVYGYFTVINQLPSYMKYILNFDIEENGLLSSLPYLGKYLFALLTATIADHLRRSGRFGVTTIRKMFTAFAELGPCILMIVLANWGCDRVIAVTIFTAALTLNGGVTGGYLGNGLDIAPNFSGTIFGLANTLSSFGGYLSSLMVGTITYQNQTYAGWSTIFWILAGTYLTAAIVFVIFGSGELQEWNDPTGHRQRAKKRHHRRASQQHEETPLQRTIA